MFCWSKKWYENLARFWGAIKINPTVQYITRWMTFFYTLKFLVFFPYGPVLSSHSHPYFTTPMTTHLESAPLKITQHTTRTASQEQRNTESRLWFPTPWRGACCCFLLFPHRAHWAVFMPFSQPFLTLSHFLLAPAWCDKRHSSFSPFNLFIFVSFPPSLLFAIERDHWDGDHK